MATLAANIVSNGAEVTHPGAVEDLLEQYQFDGFSAELEALTKPNDDEPVKIFFRGSNACGLRIMVPPEEDPDREPRNGIFFERLAEYLAEPLTIQVVGTEKLRFPALAREVTVYPSGKIYSQCLSGGEESTRGSEAILLFPTGDSPTGGHTHTLEQVEAVETDFGSKNTVEVEFVDGTTEKFTATGLTVSGFVNASLDRSDQGDHGGSDQTATVESSDRAPHLEKDPQTESGSRWAEIDIGSEGIGVTLYQNQDGLAFPIDETWYTKGEMERLLTGGDSRIILDG
jgi:hypothetical protein